MYAKKKILLAASAEPELVKKIDEMAEKTNRSRAGMILTVLKDYFNHEHKNPKS